VSMCQMLKSKWASKEVLCWN